MSANELAKVVEGTLIGNPLAEATAVSTDSRADVKGKLFVAIRGERFDGNRFIEAAFKNGATIVIGNMDAAAPDGCAYIKTSDSVRALGKLAAWHRQKFSVPIVGVTGSVGKTTTKEMIAAVLSAAFKTHYTKGNFNNAIGLPLTLLELNADTEAAVIEMGMSARGEISYLTKLTKPTLAVITNVGLSHIETLKTQENIWKAKLEIAEGLPKGATLLVNGDDAFLRQTKLPDACVKFFSLKRDDCAYSGEICGENRFRIDGHTFSVPIGGTHNLYNALAAYAAGKELGIAAETIQAGLLSYKTDGVRQSKVQIRPEVWAICDYYNASPQSMEVALEMLGRETARRRIAVLGDMLELGDMGQVCHEEAGRKAAKEGTDMLLTVGTLTIFAAKEAKKCGIAVVESFADNESLSAYLKSTLRAGDVVLIKGSHGMHMGEIFDQIQS